MVEQSDTWKLVVAVAFDVRDGHSVGDFEEQPAVGFEESGQVAGGAGQILHVFEYVIAENDVKGTESVGQGRVGDVCNL